MLNKFNILFLFLFSGIITIYAHPDSLSLPVYRITMDPASLQSLYDNPWTDLFFPATFRVNDQSYPCRVRFKGVSSRNLPKKSWRVKFDNKDNIFNARNLNLNAEYRDKSLMRNFLAMHLFDYFAYPAPETRHVNLFVNNDFLGVHLHVEDVDNTFLDKHDRPDGDIYKAKNHGATMAPLVNYDYYESTWEKKEGRPGDYTQMQELFNKFLYLPGPDFETEIQTSMSVEDVLTYFAIEYAITAEDCFTKNMIMYYNDNQNFWEILPWDNDITFGNNYNGVYLPGMTYKYKMKPLYHNQLLQRLLDNSEWNQIFVDKINLALTDGFDYLSGLIDTTYNRIKNDVYQDENKICPNDDFDSETEVLHSFLEKRAYYNAGKVTFPKTGLTDLYCSNYNPTLDSSRVVFRVTSAEKQRVRLLYIPDLEWDNFGCKYTINTLNLYDDGNHNDLEAGDLVYGNELNITHPDSNLMAFCFTGSDNNYPHNGLYNMQQVRTNTLTMLYSYVKNPVEHVSIGKVYSTFKDYFIELNNTGERNIDLSCFHLRIGQDYQDFMIPENTTLNANGKLFVSSSKGLVNNLLGDYPAVGNFFFNISPGDTIRLLSPILTDVTSKICTRLEPFNVEPVDIVINEINYHSHADFDPGDWLELYNPTSTTVDLSGWIFKDENDNHEYVLPDETFIYPNGYLVLCEDKEALTALFPGGKAVTGDFDFGLSNAGELIRLYDVNGVIIDSLTYDDHAPWPDEPDGGGPTLELIRYDMDNTLPVSWAASVGHGTPGYENSITGISDKNPRAIQDFALYQNYPNPFNAVTLIEFRNAGQKPITLEIINVRGQRVSEFTITPGTRQIKWDATGFGSGIYFYRLKAGENYYGYKKMLLLK